MTMTDSLSFTWTLISPGDIEHDPPWMTYNVVDDALEQEGLLMLMWTFLYSMLIP